MIDRLKNHLNGWKTCYLSKGGLALINAAMASILIHYSSLLVILRSICHVLEKLQRDFLWRVGEDDRGMHLVVWDRVCTPKNCGGTRLRHTEDMNKALLCRWLWRFVQEVDSLWRQVVAAKFGLVDDWDVMLNWGPFGRSPWQGMIQFS